MNNYETFRDEIILELHKIFDNSIKENIDIFMSTVDKVAQNYNIERQTTALTTYKDGIALLVKLFLGSKAVEGKAKGTLQNYGLTLRNFFMYVQKHPKDVTANDIRVFFAWYQKTRNVTSDTVEVMRHTLNSFFTWCYAEEHITKNPTTHIKAMKTQYKGRVSLDPIELEYIRDACANIREKAIIDFLFSTGCRISEMCNMEISDIDLQNGTAFIAHGKGGKSRTTYINAESVVSLKAYLKQRKDNNPYLFTFSKNISQDRPISKRAIEQTVRKVVSRCPQITKKVTPHVMRHTAATIALSNGMPIEQVKEFLGHSNLNTTLIYAKTNKDDVKRSHQKYVR